MSQLCPECKTENVDQAAYCMECGGRISIPAVEVKPAPTPQPVCEPTNDPKPPAGRVTAAVVFGLISFGVCYLIVFLLTYMLSLPLIHKILSLSIFDSASASSKELGPFVHDIGLASTSGFWAFCLAAYIGAAAGGGIAKAISSALATTMPSGLKTLCRIFLVVFIVAPLLFDWQHADVGARIVGLLLALAAVG